MILCCFMTYEVEVFVQKGNVEAEEDFSYFSRGYKHRLIKECDCEYDKIKGVIYFLEIQVEGNLDKETLSGKFSHLEFLTVESLRAKTRVERRNSIKLSGFEMAFTLAGTHSSTD